jgi:uncharacterized membrane protein
MSLVLPLVLLGLGLFGLVLSLYMTSIFVRVERGQAVTCADGSCPIVMKTPYSRSLGFPNFYLAIPFYGGLVVFAVLRLVGCAAWLFFPVLVIAVLALAMSLYLAWSLLAKLKQP